MLRRFAILATLLCCVWAIKAQTIAGYEYWLDNNYQSKVSARSTGQINTTIDCNSLDKGIHYFNIRLMDSDGDWGALKRYLFYIPAIEPTNTSLSLAEYWVDEDYTNKKSAKATGTSISLDVNLNSLSDGVHFFNIRLQNNIGEWSALKRYLFYKPETETLASAFVGAEYWFDDDYAHKHTDKCANEQNNITLDLSSLSSGTHFFNYRALNNVGEWTSLKRYLIYIPEADEYTPSKPIVGYSYSFGKVEKYVSVTPTNSFMLVDKAFDIPALRDCLPIDDKCVFTFESNAISLNRSVKLPFGLKIKDGNGTWSATSFEEIDAEETLSHPTETLGVSHSLTIDKPGIGDYAAFKIEMSESGAFYLKTSQEASIYLYNADGELYMSFAGNELLAPKQVPLYQGTYYGVVHNMITNETNQSDKVTVRLLLTESYVPNPTISYKDGIVSMSCEKEGAVIRYTLDGSDPTNSSPVYSEPFEVLRNCTIKALATFEDISPSDVVTYKVNSYKVENPVITFANLQLYMTCSTPNSAIYYTLDGRDPNTYGVQYSGPVSLSSICTAKAVAKRDGYNNSDITTYVFDDESVICPKPTFTMINNTLKIECLETESKIRYTVDGTTPSSASSVYTSPITLEHNCVVKAYAEKSGYINSEVSSYTVDWFQTDMPSFNFSGGYLTISSSTPGAKIYYTIGGVDPTQSSTLYTSPIKLTDNRQVKAIAYADNFNPSDVAVYDPDSFTCESASVSYNGRFVELETATEGANIYYTTDGTNPSTESNEYHSQFDAGGVCTIRAIVVKEAMNNSNVSSFDVPAYFDGECATVATAGSLEQGFGWCGTAEIEKIEVRGTLNANDLNTLASMPSIKHIDLSTINVENNSIPSRAFANMPIVSILMPQSIKTVGNNIFDGCENLAAIQWNPYIPLTATAMSGIDNPNLLLYVSVKSYAPNSIRNVVVDGTAENIVLSDGPSNNFYCPIRFKAKRISYTHTYTQKTIVGVCAGWETLALPFDVKSIRHSRAGEIAPFAAENTEAKPFWLYALSSTGFEPATAIEANTPYIISMPNNDSYADDYILAGDVTFIAENIDVEVTTQNIAKKGLVSFIPTTLHVDKSQDVYAINKNEPYEGKSEGSMFVLDLRDVSPFEGYWSIDGGAYRAKAFGVFDVNDFSFEMPIIAPDKSAMRVYTIGQTLYIETVSNQRVIIYSINGSLIKTVDVPAGTTKVTDLLSGFYIVNNVKIIIE